MSTLKNCINDLKKRVNHLEKIVENSELELFDIKNPPKFSRGSIVKRAGIEGQVLDSYVTKWDIWNHPIRLYRCLVGENTYSWLESNIEEINDKSNSRNKRN